MAVENLLQPRFKVIANFPDNTRNIGDIIYVDNKKEKYWSDNYEKWLSTFPHLFCKLEWWEDRKVEDLPKYLKQEKDGKIYDTYRIVKYIKMLDYSQLTFYYEWKGVLLHDSITLPDLLPATKEEYEANKII